MRRYAVLTALLAALLAAGLMARPAGAAATAPPGTASAAAYGGSAAGNAALNWAEGHAAGHPYVFGGTGPYGYDCSGLVYTAFSHAGVRLPRTTFSMLGSARLHRVPAGQERRGDLAFYGSGHVEIVTRWSRTTFGAHDSGSRVGWIREWMTPAFYRVY